MTIADQVLNLYYQSEPQSSEATKDDWIYHFGIFWRYYNKLYRSKQKIKYTTSKYVVLQFNDDSEIKIPKLSSMNEYYQPVIN